MTQADSLLASFEFDAVIADKGYDSDPLRDLLATQQVEVIIPSRGRRKQPQDSDRIRYKERHYVEHFINETIVDQFKNISQIQHTRGRALRALISI